MYRFLHVKSKNTKKCLLVTDKEKSTNILKNEAEGTSNNDAALYFQFLLHVSIDVPGVNFINILRTNVVFLRTCN